MKILTKNVQYLVIVLGIVMIWRGVWYLTDLYLLPSKPTLSAVLSIAIGVVILLLVNKKQHDIREVI